MKISTKGRYGLRAMIDLAVYSNGTHVSLFSIAERQGISGIYLEQVFATLRKAGLVKSVKGAQGGYLLCDRPENIKVGQIIRSLEGDLSVIDEQESDKTDYSLISACVKENVWDKIDDNINKLVDGITLEDLVIEQNKLNDDSGSMFHI
ncbi:MAG: Rrf2 family transcriptional regulator [Firmicutes bacterium HGW-Firmicutes-1]|jgi:Rrf2 family protein|nr:MAG: Rrf2 family transcriptional regulator [Firmicutes bacterium HGW-Firmicutes-1]